MSPEFIRKGEKSDIANEHPQRVPDMQAYRVLSRMGGGIGLAMMVRFVGLRVVVNGCG